MTQLTKVVTITRKLEVYPTGDNRDAFFAWFKQEARLQTLAKQLAYNYLFEKEIIVDRMKQLSELYQTELATMTQSVETLETEIIQSEGKAKTKLIDKHRKLLDKRNQFMSKQKSEAYATFTEAIGYSQRTEISKIIKESLDFDGVRLYDKSAYKTHIYSGIDKGLSEFKNDYLELMRGQRTPRLYRGNDLLDVRLDNSDNREINKFRFEEGKYRFNVTSQFTLTVNLGRRPSLAGQAKKTLDDVLAERYVKRCDSKLQFKDGKFYFLLVLQQEVTQPVLDKDKIMGIDLGLDIPAFAAMQFNAEIGRSFGNKKELLSFKTKIRALKDLEKKRRVYARGGQGRTRKLKNNQLEALRNRESNFSKTYNHTLSRQIVDYAVKYKVGTIRMEKLDGKSFQDTKLLGNWTYYMLQQMIETKAGAKGIEVEYVNPAYTSSTCSQCKERKEGFTLGHRDGADGREFHCNHCGLKVNSDRNAAVNIADGGVV